MDLPDDCWLIIFGSARARCNYPDTCLMLSACRLVCAAWAQMLGREAFGALWRGCVSAETVLVKASQRGCLRAASWLDRVLGFTAVSARARCNYPLRTACGRGHLEDAKWLAARFDLTGEDMGALENSALRSACTNGHNLVAEWLKPQIQLTDEDLKWARAALKNAGDQGHTETATFLRANFEFRDKDACIALAAACVAGNLETAAKLYSPGMLDEHVSYILCAVCEAGALDAAKWLVAMYRPTTKVVRSDDNYALRLACEKGAPSSSRLPGRGVRTGPR